MKVRIAFKETATGGDEVLFDVEVEAVTPGELTRVLRTKFMEGADDMPEPDLEVRHLMPVGQEEQTFGYLARWRDSYFGEQLVYGVVYTSFI